MLLIVNGRETISREIEEKHEVKNNLIGCGSCNNMSCIVLICDTDFNNPDMRFTKCADWMCCLI